MIIKNDKLIKKIRSRIHNILSTQKQRLPRNGILTGQGLASIFLEEYGFNKYNKKQKLAINDIDIFYPVPNHYTTYKKFKIRKNSKIQMIQRGYNLYIDETNSYEVVDTNFDRMINKTKVIIDTSIKYQYEEMLIIESFDFNVVQIALNLKTNQLFITEGFKNFLIDGQLKISDLNSPHHTAIRLIQKIEEHGYYCNYETELMKCKYIIENGRESKKYFSDKYAERYEKYSDILNKYFKMKKINPKIDWNMDEDDMFHSSFDFNINLYQLEFVLKESELEKYPLFNLNFTTLSELISYSDIANSSKKTNIDYLTKIHKELENYTQDYITKKTIFSIIFKNSEIKSKQKLKELISYLNKHRNLSPYFFNKEMFEIEPLLYMFKKIENKYGTVSIGIIENNQRKIINNCHIKNILKVIKKDFEIESTPLNEILSINDSQYSDFIIKELNTSIELKKEGEEMNHCVGGYASKILNTDSIIVSAKSINDYKLHITFELGDFFINKKDEIEFQVFQAYHKSNKRVSEELLKKVINLIKSSFNEENLRKKIKQINIDRQRYQSNHVPIIDIGEDEIPF